jgi:hypothetical protein
MGNKPKSGRPRGRPRKNPIKGHTETVAKTTTAGRRPKRRTSP